MLRSRLGPYFSSTTRFLCFRPVRRGGRRCSPALEDLGDVRLDLRVRQYNGVVVRRVRITQTCQEVCDRVGHRHGDLSTFLALVPLTRGLWRSGMGPCTKQGTSKTFTSSLCSRQGAVPRAPSPGRRFGTARTCGTPNAGDRNADSGCRRAPCTWACGQLWRSELSWPSDHASLKGKPSLRNNARPSSSLLALVTTVTSMPRGRSMESGLISWNIDCSFSPNV